MSSTSTHPYATGLRWLSRLSSGQPHQIIGDEDNGQQHPYLLRWYLVPRNPRFNFYLHKFLRSDDDRALHDHPWWFLSIILRGGYIEMGETTDYKMTALCRTSIFDVRSPFWRRSIGFRPATHRHIVKLPIENGIEQPCWTVVITGPKVREWGFWCKSTLHALTGRHVESRRFVHWLEWGDGGCGETT